MRYICTSILGTLVLAASTAADVQYKDICLEPSLAEVGLATYIYMALLIACITVPMMLVLWLTLTVTLKKLSPFRITFNCVAVSMMINALLLGGMLFLVHFALEPKPLTNFPALGIWIMSYAACTLGYWWFLGRIPKMKVAIMSGKPNFPYYPGKKDPAIIAKRLPDGLNLRNSLYIALFMSALQQPYYYLVYTIFSDYNT